MTATQDDTLIKSLFASDITRRIEEVIKVDQTDDEVLRDEIAEYIVTDPIQSHYIQILEAYRETPNKPHEGIAIWISGFFGSGKSSFAKMLGLSIENRLVAGEGAATRFARRARDPKLDVLLKTIVEKIPTHAVIFDVSTDRGIKSGNQRLTEIMYGLFLQSLGYARDLDLSELEIALEESKQLEQFEAKYSELFHKEWQKEKGKVVFALSEASRVMHTIDPITFPATDSWVNAVKDRSDITPGKLAERANELMKRRRPGKSLIFVVDEVGQFVARDVQKMLDLQAIVQNLGAKGRGKHWVVVTSQEKLGELVSGLDDKKIELARLMDRFPLQVHLEASDISEVTSRRILSKNATAEATLAKLFDGNRGGLTEHTRLSADIKLPELTRASFIDLYPLLPYQIDLIIQVVSGLRTQGGAARHVGGANRTIIKLAQQLLINPVVDLGNQPVGALVRLDQVYDLVEGNIGSDVRAKIASIPRELDDALAAPVAKAICLLQYVKSVHRTAENIAAVLHRSVTADSQLAPVKEALAALEKAHKIRQGDDGYRIPTPAEDDWERVRAGISPKPSDAHRIHSEIILSFWQPQPSYLLGDAKTFKAGLTIDGRSELEGDLVFHAHVADDERQLQILGNELRLRSQQERSNVFWAVSLDVAIDHETVELHRSKDMLARKEREARTMDETALVGEEKLRLRRHQDELRRLLRSAFLSGTVHFRGNDRSPGDTAVDVGKSAEKILGDVLPTVFDRFSEMAARPNDIKRGAEALLTAENLNGLPSVFAGLALVRAENGRTLFQLESGPLSVVLGRIEERTNYGETASGRFLADEFAKEPFGWDFESVRLLVLSLLRAGKIDVTTKSQTVDSATSVAARETFGNNNLFRQASFRPKKGIEFAELVAASEAFKDTFGSEVRELNTAAIASELRRAMPERQDALESALRRLTAGGLPGGGLLEDALGQLKAIQRGSDEEALGIFNASHRAIKDAIRRSAELDQTLSEQHLMELARARQVLRLFARREVGLDDELEKELLALHDLLERETFFRELAAIERHSQTLQAAFDQRYQFVLGARTAAYTSALERLATTPGWKDLDVDQQRTIAEPLSRYLTDTKDRIPFPQLQSDIDACDPRLAKAVADVYQMVEGDRVVTVNLARYFSPGVETPDQLKAALDGIEDECARLIGTGKKIVAG